MKINAQKVFRSLEKAFFLRASMCFSLAFTLIVQAVAADASNGASESSEIRFPNISTKLSNVTFVVFDTETTGLSPRNDRIVEIGAVKFRNGKVIDELTLLINPKRSIPYYVQQVHHITPDMVKDSPTFKEVYPEFEEFIKGSVLIAHNARFDLSFMHEEIARNSLIFPRNLTIDSLKLFRTWYPEAQSHSLSILADLLKVAGGSFHRAEADSMYVFLIFDKTIKERDGRLKLGDIYKLAGGPMKF